MPDTQPERQSLRQLIRQRRKSLTQAEQQQAAQQLVAQFKQHPEILAARRIALYLANDGELNPLPAIHWLWAQQKEVYLPVLHPFTPGHLLFLRYTATSPMTRNRYGIAEPELDMQQVVPHSTLDLICTPLVAFDAAGKLGLAHDCQQVDAVPQEEWDVPLPQIITPSRCWHFPG
ncbi:5-formyltetrahydrofolate cyclo-ligase [Aeromonas hydrophila]|uniref:5-formyltetrahydrofolate cyclo-ligase n=1 Tax=Aeromonas hydrophila TaxID=644 RepID=UPI00097E062A|nr:5-formyltetrahydrofolate cyclo-ligase [Aeromonas hydrophila]ONG06831.1 5-formyltetrahydrofolate cyclo-ligase [Aeromonas hydrophila]